MSNGCSWLIGGLCESHIQFVLWPKDSLPHSTRRRQSLPKNQWPAWKDASLSLRASTDTSLTGRLKGKGWAQ